MFGASALFRLGGCLLFVCAATTRSRQICVFAGPVPVGLRGQAPCCFAVAIPECGLIRRNLTCTVRFGRFRRPYDRSAYMSMPSGRSPAEIVTARAVRSASGGESSRAWHFRVRGAAWCGFLHSRPLWRRLLPRDPRRKGVAWRCRLLFRSASKRRSLPCLPFARASCEPKPPRIATLVHLALPRRTARAA